MRLSSCLSPLLLGFALASGQAPSQLALPQIVQLPQENFVWTWGSTRSVENRRRPDFEFAGVESSFHCNATGGFKPGSHMRDFSNLRDFEQSLNSTLYFIQDATNTFNTLYLSNDLQWATLDCVIPEGTESEEKAQERLDKALERAERDRDRRRAREAANEN